MGAPQPGWYDDPTMLGRYRWWDGSRWTHQTRTVAPQGAARAATGLSPSAADPTAAMADTQESASALPSAPSTTTIENATQLDIVAHPGDGRMTSEATHGGSVVRTAILVGLGVIVLAGVVIGTAVVLRGDGTPPMADESGPASVDDAAKGPIDPADHAGLPDEGPADDAKSPTTRWDDSTSNPAEGNDAMPDASADADPDATAGRPHEPAFDAVERELTMLDVLQRYLDALDRRDLPGAHGMLAPSLQAQPGWSREEFAEFWDDLIAGATLVRVVEVDVVAEELEADVIYYLQDGARSEERISVGVATADPEPRIVSYRVLSADRRT